MYVQIREEQRPNFVIYTKIYTLSLNFNEEGSSKRQELMELKITLLLFLYVPIQRFMHSMNFGWKWVIFFKKKVIDG